MRCPYCGKEIIPLRNPDGFLVCPQCATVLEEFVHVVEAEYNIRKNTTLRELEHPLNWTRPLFLEKGRGKEITSVENLIAQYWDKFLDLVKKRVPQLIQYIKEYEEWIYTEGVKVLLSKAWEVQKKGCYYISKLWLEGQFKHSGEKILYNLFIAWLVQYKGFSVYYLWKRLKVINSPEGVYSWLRLMRKYSK